MSEARAMRKVRKGVVVSNKMEKSVSVRVKRRFKHPRYERIVSRSNTFKAHDEKNECMVGDVVEIIETRPLSKTKRWRLSKIIEKAK